jgi:hypothetical protein
MSHGASIRRSGEVLAAGPAQAPGCESWQGLWFQLDVQENELSRERRGQLHADDDLGRQLEGSPGSDGSWWSCWWKWWQEAPPTCDDEHHHLTCGRSRWFWWWRRLRSQSPPSSTGASSCSRPGQPPRPGAGRWWTAWSWRTSPWWTASRRSSSPTSPDRASTGRPSPWSWSSDASARHGGWWRC